MAKDATRKGVSAPKQAKKKPIPGASKRKLPPATKQKVSNRAAKTGKVSKSSGLDQATKVDASKKVSDGEKHAGGRPTDYKPEYCELVIALGKEGRSKAQIGGRIGVARQTLENWADVHPEFLDALEKAKDFELMWWEDAAQANLISSGGVSLNASLWSRSMAARFPKDYREKVEQEISGAGGGPQLHEVVHKTALNFNEVRQARAKR